MAPESVPFFLTCCPKFIDNETVIFQTFTDPDGSNPEHNFAAFTIRVDGTRLKALPTPVVPPGSHVVPSFAVSGLDTNLARLNVPGTPVNPVPGLEFPIAEVFLQDGRNLVQLTNFHRTDTFIGFPTPGRAFFLASADPVGLNKGGFCQIFSVNTRGRDLRQVTRLDARRCGPLPPARNVGCFHTVGIGYGYYRVIFQDAATKAVVFDSACDPLGANQRGYQLFAIRPDGDGLRQLTDASGYKFNPDGSFRAEHAGPFAYSAAVH